MKTWNYHGERVPRRDVIRYRGLAVAPDTMLIGWIITWVSFALWPWVTWLGVGLMVFSVVVLMVTQR